MTYIEKGHGNAVIVTFRLRRYYITNKTKPLCCICTHFATNVYSLG